MVQISGSKNGPNFCHLAGRNVRSQNGRPETSCHTMLGPPRTSPDTFTGDVRSAQNTLQHETPRCAFCRMAQTRITSMSGATSWQACSCPLRLTTVRIFIKSSTKGTTSECFRPHATIRCRLNANVASGSRFTEPSERSRQTTSSQRIWCERSAMASPPLPKGT